MIDIMLTEILTIVNFWFMSGQDNDHVCRFAREFFVDRVWGGVFLRAIRDIIWVLLGVAERWLG